MDTELRQVKTVVAFGFERGAVVQGRVQALGVIVVVKVFS